MYNPTKWLDKVVDANTGELIQDGTDQSARHFNNMENGITDHDVAGHLALLALSRCMDEVDVEVQTVTLTNSKTFPFNDSQQTVALVTARNHMTYTVEASIGEHNGNVGDVKISNRLLNGVKVAYDGSATSATIILRIKGGM